MSICRRLSGLITALLLSACGAGGGSNASGAQAPPVAAPTNASGSSPRPQSCTTSETQAPAPSGPAPQPATGLSVPAGFTIQVIGHVTYARELAVAPNGDLFIGTLGSRIYVIQNAEAKAANAALFADVGDSPAAGVALSLSSPNCAMYVGAQFGVYRIPYFVGDSTARSAAVRIAKIRPGGSGEHDTSSVAIANNTLYASVGSSCNACVEHDATRATIQQMALDGSGMKAKAVRIRNAIALTVNPATQTLWAGDAGQDGLPQGHPYEFLDAVTLHSGVADYGWPDCEENRRAYVGGANCSGTVIARIEFPAYQTLIGAAFYAANQPGSYAFPSAYRGGMFVATHGSWHQQSGRYVSAPRVAFVPMNGDSPQKPVNWSDPTTQWRTFVGGFQLADGITRIARPTGIAVGPSGSLFIADDETGNIYRVRPQR